MTAFGDAKRAPIKSEVRQSENADLNRRPYGLEPRAPVVEPETTWVPIFVVYKVSTLGFFGPTDVFLKIRKLPITNAYRTGFAGSRVRLRAL
jgi:hypothetical protein